MERTEERMPDDPRESLHTVMTIRWPPLHSDKEKAEPWTALKQVVHDIEFDALRVNENVVVRQTEADGGRRLRKLA